MYSGRWVELDQNKCRPGSNKIRNLPFFFLLVVVALFVFLGIVGDSCYRTRVSRLKVFCTYYVLHTEPAVDHLLPVVRDVLPTSNTLLGVVDSEGKWLCCTAKTTALINWRFQNNLASAFMVINTLVVTNHRTLVRG